MIIVRNTLIVLDLIEKAESRIGKIVVPNSNDEFGEAEVMAVGPGTMSATGGVSETFDLKVGQRVWVRIKTRDPRNGTLQIAGIRYQDGDKIYYVVEQSAIAGIIAQPGSFPAPLDIVDDRNNAA